MNVKVTFEFSTPEDAITAIARLRGLEASAPPAAATLAPVKEAIKPPKSATTDKPADGKPVVKEPLVTAPEKKEPASSASVTPAASPPNPYEPVGTAIKNAVVTHRAEVIALLAEFDAKSGKDLKVEQYESFLAKLTAAVSPSEDLG